jgi:hypothetical protein
MTKRQQRLKHYLTNVTDTVVFSSDIGFVDYLLASLQSVVEGIETGDGIHIEVKNIRLMFRLNKSSHITAVPVVCQTAGNCLDQTDLAQRKIQDLLDQSIDDVFGFEMISPVRTSRSKPDASNYFKIEVTIDLPQRYVQLLNKETETERLQDLYIAIVGIVQNTTGDLSIYMGADISYTETRKTITFR